MMVFRNGFIGLCILICLSLSNLLALNNPVSVFRTYEIGEYAQGGVVFWLTPDKKHGLVAAIEDQSTGVEWASMAVEINAYANDLTRGREFMTSGKVNTETLIGLLGTATPYAALVASQYQPMVNGVLYDDWYLPSFQEFSVMIARVNEINSTSLANGGTAFSSSLYWTSTQVSDPILGVPATQAQAVNMDFTSLTAGNISVLKNSAVPGVRAIRSF